MHHRLEPKKHRFHYNVFMFYLDLDEIDSLASRFWMLSRNRFNIFSFRDSEHLQLPIEHPDQSKNVKEHIVNYLTQNGFTYKDQKIMLLTNLNMFGYNFNPVSFYFVLGENGIPHCAIAEVSNTFGEMKPYFLGPDCFTEGVFKLKTTKFFYVSPFIDHDASFDFHLVVPGEKLNIRIDDSKHERRFFISTLSGVKRRLSSWRLFWYCLRFPFITLQIISLIHWNALRLWLKKVRFYKKGEFANLQQGVYRKFDETK